MGQIEMLKVGQMIVSWAWLEEKKKKNDTAEIFFFI